MPEENRPDGCPFVSDSNMPKKQFGALVAIALFVLSHLGVSLWWAGSLNTAMAFHANSLTELKTLVSQSLLNKYTTIDAAKDFQIRDQIRDANSAAIRKLEADVIRMQVQLDSMKPAKP